MTLGGTLNPINPQWIFVIFRPQVIWLGFEYSSMWLFIKDKWNAQVQQWMFDVILVGMCEKEVDELSFWTIFGNNDDDIFVAVEYLIMKWHWHEYLQDNYIDTNDDIHNSSYNYCTVIKSTINYHECKEGSGFRTQLKRNNIDLSFHGCSILILKMV